MRDPLLADDWHPVLASAALGAGAVRRVTLLGQDVALWRGADGVARAWEDRCPHRGTRLSCGRVDGAQLVCAYHAWRFDGAGRCVGIPAHHDLTIPDSYRATAYRVEEKYGLVWASIGTPRCGVLPFPECDDPQLRTVVCGPYDVETCGPRIVENFLDMGHFPFVHPGILGDPARTEVRDYQVGPFDDGSGAPAGVIATRCFFWQPQTNSLAHGGTDVEYSYRVPRPLTAILTKVPQLQDGFREAISLHVQPVEQERSVVWVVLALTNFQESDEQLRSFQDRIFLQDKPILENQVPRRLPLAPRAELPVRSDRMSLAYRSYLRDLGMSYGVLVD
jgi:phenylpropionate dioxygenase-like ring-hydroxylating dioxygenase large terminal subunit